MEGGGGFHKDQGMGAQSKVQSPDVPWQVCSMLTWSPHHLGRLSHQFLLGR